MKRKGEATENRLWITAAKEVIETNLTFDSLSPPWNWVGLQTGSLESLWWVGKSGSGVSHRDIFFANIHVINLLSKITELYTGNRLAFFVPRMHKREVCHIQCCYWSLLAHWITNLTKTTQGWYLDASFTSHVCHAEYRVGKSCICMFLMECLWLALHALTQKRVPKNDIVIITLNSQYN